MADRILITNFDPFGASAPKGIVDKVANADIVIHNGTCVKHRDTAIPEDHVDVEMIYEISPKVTEAFLVGFAAALLLSIIVAVLVTI